MYGHGTRAKLAPAYQKTPANVSFYVNGYKTSPTRFAQFGPEIGFAHVLGRSYPNTQIKLIKFAVGGTSLLAWDPNWNLGRARLTKNGGAGSLYQKLVKTIRRSFGDEEVKIDGVLWMQGETDARYPDVAKRYAQNLNAFVRALRVEFTSPHMPFIMGSVNPPEDKFPGTLVVQKAQVIAASTIKNVQLIATEDLSKRSDLLHYDAAGQLELGKRFAKAYLKTGR